MSPAAIPFGSCRTRQRKDIERVACASALKEVNGRIVFHISSHSGYDESEATGPEKPGPQHLPARNRIIGAARALAFPRTSSMIDLDDPQAVKEASRANRRRRFRSSASGRGLSHHLTVNPPWRARGSVRPPRETCQNRPVMTPAIVRRLGSDGRRSSGRLAAVWRPWRGCARRQQLARMCRACLASSPICDPRRCHPRHALPARPAMVRSFISSRSISATEARIWNTAPRWRGRVEPIRQRPEIDLARREVGRQIEALDRAAQPIELPDDQRVAARTKLRARSGRAGFSFAPLNLVCETAFRTRLWSRIGFAASGPDRTSRHAHNQPA